MRIIDYCKGLALALVLTLTAAAIAAGLVYWLGYWGLLAIVCAVTVTAAWALRNWS